MVSGLTPPSKRKDKLDLRGDINSLTEIVRTGASSTGIAAISGGQMAGDSSPTSTTSTGGMLSMNPQVAVQSVIMTYTEDDDNEHRLESGHIIQSSLGSGNSKWEGTLLYHLQEEKDDDSFKHVGVFQPTNPKQLTFTNSAQSFIQINEDGGTIAGWEGDYTIGDLNEFNDKCLPIVSSTSIVESASGGSAEIQWIKGSMNNGHIITLKPREGKNLTLKSGGNIDIDSDLVVADNEVAFLQMFWDSNHSIKFTGGGGEGAKAVAYVEDDDGATTLAQVGRVQSVLVTHKGRGYTSNPTVTIEGGEGEDAEFTASISDGEVISVTVTDKGKGYGITGRWVVIKSGSGGGVDATADVVWTGRHKFHADPVGEIGDSNEANTIEFGNAGSDRIKFIGEISGGLGMSMSNPEAGSGTIAVPPTSGGVSIEPTLSIKSAIIMNTYTMYDLDTLVFSQAQSSTTPPPENDWVYIEADTGTSGSPSLQGMQYNVPDNKEHKFKVNGSQTFGVMEEGIRLYNTGQGTLQSTQVGLWVDNDGLKINVPENDYFSFQEGGEEKVRFQESQANFHVPIYLSSDVNDAFVDFFNESSNNVGQPSSNHIRLFCDSGNSDHMSIRRDSTVVDLEGGGGVELTDNPTWTGSHVFNGIVKFHKDGGDNDYDAGTTAGVEIGYDGNDRCLFNGFIMGNGGYGITPPSGSGSYTLDNTEYAINCHSALVMNTYSIWDLDQLVFSVGESTSLPNMISNWWGIEVEHYNSTSNGHSYRSLAHYVPSGRKHVFLVNDKSVAQFGDEILYMNADEYNTIQFKGVDGSTGGLDIIVNDSAYTGQEIRFFVQGGGNSNSVVASVYNEGIKLASGKKIRWTTYSNGSYKAGGGYQSTAGLYPDRWVKIFIGTNEYFVPCYE